MAVKKVTIRNSSVRPFGKPAGARTEANKRRGKKRGGKRRNGPATPAAAKSTALAKRPNGTTPAAAAKFIAQGRSLERQTLKANGKLVTKQANRKGKKRRGGKRRNGAGGGLMGALGAPFRALRNPSLGNIMDTLKTAGIGVGGAAVSRIGAGVVLGLGDRFAPEYTDYRYASPVVTLLFGLFGLPFVMDKVGMDRRTQDVATTGAVLFAAGEALNIATGGDKAAEVANNLRFQVGGRALPAAGGASTVGAAVGAQNAQEAAAAANGAMAGLAAYRRGPVNVPPRPVPVAAAGNRRNPFL